MWQRREVDALPNQPILSRNVTKRQQTGIENDDGREEVLMVSHKKSSNIWIHDSFRPDGKDYSMRVGKMRPLHVVKRQLINNGGNVDHGGKRK